jgi:two-component system response regulator RegX3
MHVGVIEDDGDQRSLACLWLKEAGHGFGEFESVAAALAGLAQQRFDALLLDWMLPDGTGEQVVQWVRGNLGWDLAVVVLTARDEEDVVVRALKAGADDYVVKPAKQQELLARLAAAARRARPGGMQVLRLGPYEADLQRQRLARAGEPLTLTQKEFDLAVVLLQNPGKLLSRDHLLNRVWGLNTDVDTRTVDTHVSRVRKKLGLDGGGGWKLMPVYGYGYRLDRLQDGAGA